MIQNRNSEKMKIPTTDRDLLIKESILKRLIYFDIFSYPLTATEVIRYCNYPDLDEIEGLSALYDLKKKKIIHQHTAYFYMGKDITKVNNRIRDNRLADKRMETACRYATLISNFPFVRAVFISGSLSKNVMKPDSDIDFFIITVPGRLWLCRGLLTLFKKIFLGNSHRNFCINYFIDTDSLEIPDKNLFTATEIAFLIPMYNYSLYQDFIRANEWFRLEYPNLATREEKIKIRPLRIRMIFESLMKNRIGNWLDDKCFSAIYEYWRMKFHWMDNESFTFNFRSFKNVSKHHPYSFQKRVLQAYSEKVQWIDRVFDQRGFPEEEIDHLTA